MMPKMLGLSEETESPLGLHVGGCRIAEYRAAELDTAPLLAAPTFAGNLRITYLFIELVQLRNNYEILRF